MIVISLLFSTQVFADSSNINTGQNDSKEKVNSMDSIKTYQETIKHLDKESYGGMYLDEYGNLNVLMKDVEKTNKVLNAYRKENQIIVYRDAKFSLAELERVNGILLKNMVDLGIDTLEIDGMNNCVTIGIYQMDRFDAQEKDKIKQRISDLVKSDCINIKSNTTKPYDQATFTIKNGSELSTTSSVFSSCIGVKWTDSGTTKYGFLTAGHAASLGDTVNYSGVTLGPVVKRQYGGSVDAEIIERSTSPNTFNQTRNFTDNTAYTASSNDWYVSGGFPVGTNVTLYGRTTKKITGKITSTSFSVIANGTSFTNLVKTSYVSLPGDSGGPIKVDVNAGGLLYTYVAGVHKGGDGSSYGYYSDMSNVKSALGFHGSYQ